MATTINSTALDFNNIKNNLKTYLQQKDEFRDYNFEASGLSNLLDVLAYNTHINALIANFVANESYLNTAQLRSSVVSLAETLGYIPMSNTSAVATVRISASDNSAPVNVTLPAYSQFTGELDNATYTFLTAEPLVGVKSSTGFFRFTTVEGNGDIPIYQGEYKRVTFNVAPADVSPIFYVKNTQLDTATVTVKVYPTGSGSFTEYTNINKLATIDESSTFYILRESPIGGFDLTFGDNNGFGVYPDPGSVVVVDFIEGLGDGSAAGIGTFTAVSGVPWTTYSNGVPTNGTSTLTVVAVSPSSGGNGKESLSSIKLKAPFTYATQNRAITVQDYIMLINKSYGRYLQDVTAWGGQDDVDREFGAIYVSLNFNDTVTSSFRTEIKNNIIDIQKKLGIISYRLRFVDPDITYASLNVTAYYNPVYSSNQAGGIDLNISTALTNYFNENVNSNRFQQSIQTSKIISYVDAADPGIIGSVVDLLLQKQFVPSAPSVRSLLIELADLVPLTVDEIATLLLDIRSFRYERVVNYMLSKSSSSAAVIRNTLVNASNNLNQTLYFPVELADPTSTTDVITSSSFTFNNLTCVIKNIPQTYTLAIFNSINNSLINNIGYFNENGETVVDYFTPTNISGSTLKLFAKPKNKAIVSLDRNELVQYDNTGTAITLVKTSSKR